jgi:hypothetical protein
MNLREPYRQKKFIDWLNEVESIFFIKSKSGLIHKDWSTHTFYIYSTGFLHTIIFDKGKYDQ